MSSVRENLNQVWSEFRKAGITDDLSVIEYIARLLIEEILELSPPVQKNYKNYRVTGFVTDSKPHETLGMSIPFFYPENTVSEKLIPRSPPSELNISTEDIKQHLRKAAEQAEGIANLFDRHVLFRLPTMLPGGRYPTPRHIIEFMLSLAQVEQNHSLADFACGSGGFLVRLQITDTTNLGETIGIDISPEWIRLAWANIALLKIPPNLETGNALKVCGSEKFAKKTFERILMNPPFGERIDEKLAEETLGEKVGSRSETALTALAIKKLAEGGKAAILVPSGLLSSNNTGDRTLRKQLVVDHELEAVITLPKEALQPYSPLQTHLLLVRKSQPQEENQTWFWQVEQDGYPSGRGRDLTENPTEASDLPFIEEVFAKQNNDFERVFPDEVERQVGVKWLRNNDNLIGIVCQSLTGNIFSYRFDSPANEKATNLILEIGTSKSKQDVSITIPSKEEIKQELSSDEDRLQEDTETESLPDKSIRLLPQPVKAVAIALPGANQILRIGEARLLGVAVQCNIIQKPIYDLRPESYMGKQEESRITDSPADILARIYRNQRKLSQHIDNLFGRLELPPIVNQKLPSPIAPEAEPFGTLSKDQQEVWERVCQKIEPITTNEGETYETALHFTSKEVDPGDNEEISDATRATLDLLERMGVIVPVIITDPNTNEPLAFYRRVTELDRWELDSNDSDSG